MPEDVILPEDEADATRKRKYYTDMTYATLMKKRLAEAEPVSDGSGQSLSAKIRQSFEEGLSLRAYMATAGPVMDRLEAMERESAERRAQNTNVAGPDGQPGNRPLMTPQQKGQAAQEYMKYLVSIGKTPDEIEAHMAKWSTSLDFISQPQYLNPLYQNALVSRTMGAEPNEKFGFKEAIETFRALGDVQGGNKGANPAELITAMGAFAQAFKNPTAADPAQMFQAGMTAGMEALKNQNEGTRIMFQQQMEFMRTQMETMRQEKDPAEYLKSIRGLADEMGWTGGEQTPEERMERLNMEREDRQHAYEMEREKWNRGWTEKSEAAKERRQFELVKGITGAISKVVESPVIKELGKGVGEKIGVKNPMPQAQAAAAKQALENPLETAYSFKCGKCASDYTFTAKELTAIQEKGGKWACQKCGEGYQLRAPPDKKP